MTSFCLMSSERRCFVDFTLSETGLDVSVYCESLPRVCGNGKKLHLGHLDLGMKIIVIRL